MRDRSSTTCLWSWPASSRGRDSSSPPSSVCVRVRHARTSSSCCGSRCPSSSSPSPAPSCPVTSFPASPPPRRCWGGGGGRSPGGGGGGPAPPPPPPPPPPPRPPRVGARSLPARPWARGPRLGRLAHGLDGRVLLQRRPRPRGGGAGGDLRGDRGGPTTRPGRALGAATARGGEGPRGDERGRGTAGARAPAGRAAAGYDER